MKISFERSGGFAGMRLALIIDTASLPAQDAASLQKLITEADFFNVADDSSTKALPDGFQYTVSVQADGKQRTLHLRDGAIPDKLQPLLQDLSGRARFQRGVA